MFIDKLIEKIKETNNPTVLGLDPRIEYVPKFIQENAVAQYGNTLKAVGESILAFNQALLDELEGLVPIVKPQLAYYEMYGIEGIEAFYKTVRYAKEKGFLVLADGKRNDIGSTAEAYATAYLGEAKLPNGEHTVVFDVDALTVNPYLGMDGIIPFVHQCKKKEKGIFILVKTSNPSSSEIQDLELKNNKTLYEVVAEYVNQWGEEVIGKYGYSSVGAVVGATFPEQAKKIRKLLKHAYILVPGYGAQGGTAEDAARSFNDDGLGAIVNASRSIMCAYQSKEWKDKFGEKEFAKAARAEAEKMRDEINKALQK